MHRYKVMTVWDSPGKNHNGDPFLKVKQTGKYFYSERAGRDSLAFILYDELMGEVCLINESKPPLGEGVFKTTAFGGSLDDPSLTVEKLCIREVKEEAGYIVTWENINYVGQVLVSTQSNQYCHLYLVDVSGIPQGERELQDGEEGSEIAWMSIEDAIGVEDWKAATIISKAVQKEII